MTQAILQTIAVDEQVDRSLLNLVDAQASSQAGAALLRAAGRSDHDALSAAAAFLAGNPGASERLCKGVTSGEIPSLLPAWIRELREAASLWPDCGACTVATALELWLWTVKHMEGTPQAIDELAEAVCPLLAARCLALDVALGDAVRPELGQVYAAHASAAAGSLCAELVFGYRRHLVWDAEGCATCYSADELDDLEAMIPGFAAGACVSADIIESDGSHPAKQGPCAGFGGLDGFMRLRNRLDACLTGARLARDRAAIALARSA